MGSDHSSFEEETSWIEAPPAAYELLLRCLELNFYQRITATQATYKSSIS